MADKRVELLAPAKDKECAIAAIESGADAIYIGAPSFGARHNARNSIEDIKEIIDYAHKFYVKVHVTINTILTDEELVEAEKLISRLYEIGADAIIVQDMGILKLAVEGKLPPIPIHASTQCDNRTLEKVLFFEKLGLSRVILAREMSMDKITEICNSLHPLGEDGHSTGKGLEIETFIHGALCVSYSGQCYLSAAIGGRSANRGECAQPCRKKYTVIDEEGNIIAKDKYLLCLKDFNAAEHLNKLIGAGVKSFKIEGRLKNSDYVKNVTAYYRQEIDKYCSKTSSGKVFLDFKPDLSKSFNRGFTDYFLNGRKKCFNLDTQKALGENLGKVFKTGKDFFEIIRNSSFSENEEISAQDGLCFFCGGEMRGCLVNKVDGSKIYPNKMNDIQSGITIYRNNNVKFEKQLKSSKTKRRIRVDFSFAEGILEAADEDNNRVQVRLPVSETPNNPEKMRENFIKQLKKTGESDFYAEKVTINGDNLPFLPISVLNEYRRELLDKLMTERLKNYKREGQKPLHYAEFPQNEIDYRGNVHNKAAEEFYERCGSKVSEMSVESTRDFSGKTLMHTKHCIKHALDMCKSFKKLFLIDEKGKKYPLQFDCKNCEMKVISP